MSAVGDVDVAASEVTTGASDADCPRSNSRPASWLLGLLSRGPFLEGPGKDRPVGLTGVGPAAAGVADVAVAGGVRRWRSDRSLAGRSVALIWLVFLIEPLLQLLNDGSKVTATHRLVTIAVVVVFATLYCTLNLVSDERTNAMSPAANLTVVAAMWALTVFLVFYDRPSWDYEFIFSVFPAMRLLGCRPRTVIGTAVVAIGVGVIAGLDPSDLLVIAVIIVGVGISMFGVFRLIDANVALQGAQADQARAAVAEERLRFARDLHDLLGHSLSVISLKSEVAAKVLTSDVDRAGREVDEIHDIARRALREVRDAVSGYRQTTVDVELAGARTALAAAGIAWQEDITDVDLPEDVEATLAWTLREGVTNVLRHAGASACELRIGADDELVTVTVADDGGGCGAPKDGADPLPIPGNGLAGLGERVAALDGRIDAGPGADGGFTLRVSLPR